MKLLYVEKQVLDLPLTQSILSKFPNAQIVPVTHYKNIFDKNFGRFDTEKCLILARMTGNALLPVPVSYGYPARSYFLRVALNCLFDCSYCFLKGAFRNDFPVVFVNYHEIQEQIDTELKRLPGDEQVWIYPSNFSDIQAFDQLIQFNAHFFPFFQKYPNLMVESRTKSSSISSLLEFTPPPSNVEIAYSLNPQQIIDRYERATPPLAKRVDAVNRLLEHGYRVWLRFLPLIPVDDTFQIYSSFINYLKASIDFERISSFFTWGLLLTQHDYTHMIKKNPSSDLWTMLQSNEGWMMRLDPKTRKLFYELFRSIDPRVKVCFDDL